MAQPHTFEPAVGVCDVFEPHDPPEDRTRYENRSCVPLLSAKAQTSVPSDRRCADTYCSVAPVAASTLSSVVVQVSDDIENTCRYTASGWV